MSAALPEGAWRVDPGRSRVAFQVKHMAVSTVHGSFGEFAGELRRDRRGLHAGGSVRTASIGTGDQLRDSMLPGANFLDAEANPEISFAAQLAPAPGSGEFDLPGELTIAGGGGPLTLAVSVSRLDGGDLALTAHGQLRRSDFGLRFHGPMAAGDRAVGDRVSIELELRLVPAG